MCLRRPLHSTLLFSSSSSYTTATRTSTISPKRLGRVWSRRSLSFFGQKEISLTTKQQREHQDRACLQTDPWHQPPKHKVSPQVDWKKQ